MPSKLTAKVEFWPGGDISRIYTNTFKLKAERDFDKIVACLKDDEEAFRAYLMNGKRVIRTVSL